MKLITGAALRAFASDHIAGYLPSLVGVTEVDIRVGESIRIYPSTLQKDTVDLTATTSDLLFITKPILESGVYLKPREFILLQSHEFFTMPSHVQGMLTLRSWAAKSGLSQTASLILKPNWKGNLILELTNDLSLVTLVIKKGLPIAQTQFYDISEDLELGNYTETQW